MAIARVKTWSAGEVLTANDLNNEFNNITNNALLEPFVATQQVDLNGQLLLFDVDGNTLLDGSTNNQITMNIGGSADFRFTINTFTALSGSVITLAAGNINMSSGDVQFTSGRVIGAKASDVASATAITPPTTGNTFDLTGTATIESFSITQAGTNYRVRYTGAGLNLIYNATSLRTPFATDYRLVTNEVFDLVSLGSGNYYMVPVGGCPGLQTGTPFQWWGTTAPVGGVLMDATALLCTTYYGLSKILVPSASTLGNVGTSVGTFTVNTGTDVLICTAHGLAVNDIVHVTNAGGGLPAPLVANTVYFVRTVVDADNFTLAATRGGALIDITTAGTGTQTVHNKVNAPDARGRVWMGIDGGAARVTSASTNGANADTLGGVGGTETHTLTTTESAAHTHMQNEYGATAIGSLLTGAPGTSFSATPTNTIVTDSTGGGGAHSNTQPWIAGGMAIRF